MGETDRPGGPLEPAMAAAFIAACHDAFIAVDPSFRVIAWNAAAERLLGWRAEEVVGGPPPHLPADDAARLRAELGPDVQPDDGTRLATRVRKDGTTVTVVVERQVALRDREGRVQGWGRFMRAARAEDLRGAPGSEQPAAELLARMEALEELDRLRNDYITGITHDLQIPLTGLIGYAATLRRGGDELSPEERAECLDALQRQARRVAALVDDMLLGARLESGDLGPDDPELIDLSVLADDVVTLFGPHQRDRIRIEARLPAPVLADRHQLERVLQNLIDNALKYAPAPSPVLVRVADDGERALLSVRDEGCGIAESERPQVFSRHGRAGSARRGSTGLGLYIVRGIVAAHGGEVTIDSEPDVGTTFLVALPLAPKG